MVASGFLYVCGFSVALPEELQQVGRVSGQQVGALGQFAGGEEAAEVLLLKHEGGREEVARLRQQFSVGPLEGFVALCGAAVGTVNEGGDASVNGAVLVGEPDIVFVIVEVMFCGLRKKRNPQKDAAGTVGGKGDVRAGRLACERKEPRNRAMQGKAFGPCNRHLQQKRHGVGFIAVNLRVLHRGLRDIQTRQKAAEGDKPQEVFAVVPRQVMEAGFRGGKVAFGEADELGVEANESAAVVRVLAVVPGKGL